VRGDRDALSIGDAAAALFPHGFDDGNGFISPKDSALDSCDIFEELAPKVSFSKPDAAAEISGKVKCFCFSFSSFIEHFKVFACALWPKVCVGVFAVKSMKVRTVC
jgi:hypothetical protein